MDFVLDWPAIHAAARKLETGQLVAFPTETVYGLGADAENPDAVAKIYAAKGRPSDHPVIVHIASQTSIAHWVQGVPVEASRLIDAFWPGPLTLILKRATHIPDAVSGGQDTIGVRCPSHPVAQALLQSFKNGKGGIAAPSANRFGHVSPTTAQHVRDEFGNEPLVQCILEGGQSEVGIESTILDLSRIDTHGAVMLRPGQITAEQIAHVLGGAPRMPDAAAPRASGTLEAHYAPRTPVALVDAGQLQTVLQQLAGRRIALIHQSQSTFQAVLAQAALPQDPNGYAHGMYAALRELDAAAAEAILIAAPPQGAAWDGVNDRLRRAAHDSLGILERLMTS